ncbi:methyl-accepting chemotaxis protein [Pseudomonas frederiksbergensis]
MSNNFSLVPLTAALLLLSGAGAAFTGYNFIKNSEQEDYLLTQAYDAQTKGMQAVYMSERAAVDGAYTTELESLDSSVERALSAIRSGDPVRGIPAAPDSILRNLEAFQKNWDELAPSISQILSQRGATGEFSRNLSETRSVAKDALSAAKLALAELPSSSASPALKAQLTKAVAVLEDGVSAMDTGVNTDTLSAAQASFGEFVSSLSAMGASLPKEQALMTQLSKSFTDAKSVQRLMVKTINSSSSASENIPHAKTIWAAREKLSSAAATLVASIQALPASRAYGATAVAGLGAITILLAFAAMMMMRTITNNQTSRIQIQGRNLEVLTQKKSKELQTLLDEIHRVYSGELSTVLTEDNDSTREIAKALNTVFRKINSILSEVRETILDLSAATEQAMITDRNVGQNRDAQGKAVDHVTALILGMLRFIDQIEKLTIDTEMTSSDVLDRVRSGTDAVTRVHDSIVSLQQQTTAIQHSSKNLIESFQNLEKISDVVSEVSQKSALLSFNAEIQAGKIGDKEVSAGISQSAEAMGRQATEAKKAVVEIGMLLKQMNEAARETQSAVDLLQREAETLRNRSNTAQEALGDINEMTTRLAQGMSRVREETHTLQSKSGEVNDTMGSIQHYSTESSAASEQTANAIHNVNGKAQDLSETIVQFAKA